MSFECRSCQCLLVSFMSLYVVRVPFMFVLSFEYSSSSVCPCCVAFPQASEVAWPNLSLFIVRFYLGLIYSYLLFYPTLGIAPSLTQVPIVFWYLLHILATLLPFDLRHVSGVLCSGTPLRPHLLRCVSWTLVRMDRVVWALLCLHTFDTFVLLNHCFTSFA